MIPPSSRGSFPGQSARSCSFLRTEGATATPAAPEDVTRVVVVAGTDDDGLAAVEQAYRFASRRGVELVLVQGRDRREERRVAGLQRRLAVGGRVVESISMAAQDLDAPGLLRVCGWSDWHKDPLEAGARVLVVKGAPDDHGERLGKLLADGASRAAPQGAEHA